MPIKVVKINTIDKVKKFVKEIEGLRGDIDASIDHYVVDARSGLGLFSLNLKKPIVITFNSDDKVEIEKFNRIMEEFE